jgi:preprotein translocase subunit SecE
MIWGHAFVEHTDTKAIQKMEVKKKSALSASKFEGKKVVEFVGAIKQEFRRIEWTNAGELKSYTKIVLASIFLFGMGIYLIDLILQGILGGVNIVVKFFTG